MPKSTIPFQGIYAITPDSQDDVLLTESVDFVLSAGVKILQYRNKIVSNDQALRQAFLLKEICLKHQTIFIINDDLRMTQALDADGVHLGKDDFNLIDGNLTKIRQNFNLSDKIIGISCYNNLNLARRAIDQYADYIAFGAVFASPTKKNATKVDIDVLKEAKQQFNLPIVAIGGINFENAIQLQSTNINCLAIISALFDELFSPNLTNNQKELHLEKIKKLQQVLIS